MSAGCLRLMLGHATRTMCGGSAVYLTPASRFNICHARQDITSASWRCSSSSTDVPQTEQTSAPKKKKSPEASIINFGSKLPYNLIQVISEDGKNLGAMRQANLIKIMGKKNLKLVLLNKQKDPPVYQLMSEKQICEDLPNQTKKEEASAPVQMKLLTFSQCVAPHDLSTKCKQVESLLKKKYHIKISMRLKPWEPEVNLIPQLKKLVEEFRLQLLQMGVLMEYGALPVTAKDGRSVSCTIKSLSKKKLMQMENTASTAPASESEPSSTNSTDTSEESIQHGSDNKE